MPEVDVPLFNGVYRNIDESVANDALWRLVDGILDEGPSIFTRPGLESRANSGQPAQIDGMFWWDHLGYLMFVSGGELLSYVPSTGALSNLGGDTLLSGARATFAANATNVYVANGGRIVRWNPAIAPTYIPDADAPTAVTHVAIIDTYLVANKVGTGILYFSLPGDPLSWQALDFVEAESEPDVVTSIVKFRDELYLHGKKTFEIFEDDGQTPFARVAGGAFNTGCAAPYSVVRLDNDVMWLSEERKFVRFGGGQIEVFESQYDKEIKSFAVVSDCTADRYDIEGKTLIVFQFPSQARTLVYNATNGNWCEWGYWNSTSGAHDPFLGSSYAYCPQNGKHYVGSRRNDGSLLEMNKTFVTDLTNPIKMVVESGHVNYGTNNIKQSERLTLRVKRGFITDAASFPVATLQFKDDGQEWDQERQFSLGSVGDYFNTVRFERLGRYRSRKYRFSCSDSIGFVFSEAKETIRDTGR